ncbi:hypothetical protein CXB77_18525 [Chromatium okenii]|uniref:Dynamin N-terminal domain-containing protein n=1 Tax=Chromatium okenii TaxID=61644 RepID=A0A2S7XM00_9GAMM|nr:hypothetical protein CXB77_18525 [Chromatium okenii]
MNQPIAQLSLQISTYCEQLNEHVDSFTEVNDLIALKKELADKVARFSADEQRLSIGIMGQVKAGKSSFINALLFDGQPILPEAATPKTANLTRITYGEQPRLEVEFYEPHEWQEIEALSAGAGNHPQAKVARELVRLANDNEIDVFAELQKGDRKEFCTEDITGLLGLLNDYTGENGRYTALVKMTHLYLPDHALQGYEVVDTPGMNDPIESRTQKTRDYMSQCDVVFFLSRSSQFLDQPDMELLSQQLPGKGVKRMVLVAGQFDSAILDDGHDQDSLTATTDNLKTRLSRGAATKIHKMAAQREQIHPESAVILRQMTQPIFASTFAHGYANWSREKWTTTMLHVHGELVELARQNWNDYAFTDEDWQHIGNFQALLNAYDLARQDRKTLLQEQQDSIVPGVRQQLQERLRRLLDAVENRHRQLHKGDIRKLQDQQSACETRIRHLERILGQRIDETLHQAKHSSQKLLHEIQGSIGQYAQLNTRSGSKTEERYHTVSFHLFKPSTWFGGKTYTETVVINYEYLSPTDAIEQLRHYARSCTFEIEQGFNRLIDPDALKLSLRKTLINEIDTQSENFDPDQFRSMLINSLERLTIPVLTLDAGDMTQLISRNFKGEIKDRDAIESLRETLNQALHDVFTKLADCFRNAAGDLYQQLEQLRNSLGEKLTADIKRELDQLRQDFTNKQEQLDRYQHLIEQLTFAQREIV